MFVKIHARAYRFTFPFLNELWLTTWEGEKNEEIEECELENVNHHSAQGHLRWRITGRWPFDTTRIRWAFELVIVLYIARLCCALTCGAVTVYLNWIDDWPVVVRGRGWQRKCRQVSTKKICSPQRKDPEKMIENSGLSIWLDYSTSDMRVGSQASQSSLKEKDGQIYILHLGGESGRQSLPC